MRGRRRHKRKARPFLTSPKKSSDIFFFSFVFFLFFLEFFFLCVLFSLRHYSIFRFFFDTKNKRNFFEKKSKKLEHTIIINSITLWRRSSKKALSRDRTERKREREINDRGKDDDDDDKKRGDFFARVDFEGLRDEQRSISESTPTRIVVVFVGKNVSRGGGSREGGGGGSRRRRRRRR